MELEQTWIEKLQSAFVDYEAFVKDLIPDYPANPSQIHHRIWNNKINFIHCNTALVADGKQKKNQLMDIHKMAMEKYRTDIPNIILAHNCFYDLHVEQQKRIQDIVRNHPVCAYFCGDRHVEKVEQIVYECNQNRQIPCVVGYKSSPEAIDDYSVFGMIIGEWEESERIASLKGWTWKSGKGFEIDATITEQEIDMTGRLNDTGAIDDLVENMTKVKKENFKNSIDEVDQRKIDDNTKQYFIKLYYNMTPAQIEVFNREYDSTKMRLKKKMSSKEVIDYVIRSEEKGLLKEMVHYIRELFE